MINDATQQYIDETRHLVPEPKAITKADLMDKTHKNRFKLATNEFLAACKAEEAIHRELDRMYYSKRGK